MPERMRKFALHYQRGDYDGMAPSVQPLSPVYATYTVCIIYLGCNNTGFEDTTEKRTEESRV